MAADGIELDEALQREIADLEARIPTQNVFLLLGVPIDADRATVKKSFHALCLRLHPDRFFRKNLGPFRPRLERVFQALQSAHQTLSDPARRDAYLAAHPELRPPPPRKRGERLMLNRADLLLPPKKD